MNVLSLKNGEPEGQTAKGYYCIRGTGLSTSGMLPRQDDALMEVPRAHAHAADSSLLSPFRESIAENARPIKNGGPPQPVLGYLPDTVKEGLRPTPSRLTAEGHRFRSCPADRKKTPLRWMP